MVCSGTLGAEIADAMRHGPDRLDAAQLLAGQFQVLGPREWAMYKPRWGAFYQTHLEEWLRAEGVSTVVFAGCNFPNCPRTSIYSKRASATSVSCSAGDGVSGRDDRGRDELTNIGIAVLPTATIIAALAASMTAKD